MKKIYRGATIAIFISLMSTSALTAQVESVIYNFTGNGNGYEPTGGLIADDHGALYGTTVAGGGTFGTGLGTVFKLTPPANNQTVWTETVLHRFTVGGSGGPDGINPETGLILVNGVLYGTTVMRSLGS
jgi:hypothetical protein